MYHAEQDLDMFASEKNHANEIAAPALYGLFAQR